MSEGDPAVGLGQAMGDVILLKMREREMKQTIRDQAQLIKDHETIFMETKARLHKRITELEAEYAERVRAAIAALEKHDCHPSCDGVPEKVLALLRLPAAPRPVYTAIFLDEVSKETLLKAFPPIHPKVFGHHITLAFHKAYPERARVFDPLIGKGVEFEVVGEASDDKGQAVKVTLPAPYPEMNPDQVHHVTISCVGSPVYSNELLKKGWGTVAPIRLKGTVRHFTG